MSKYTTELRYICETASGLVESKGYNDIADIIDSARSYLFSFDYPIYDENYRSVLETKIIKHFYTREIGVETVGLFKLRLDTKMNEIMPYYNKLYESELIEFNPLYSTDIRKTREGNRVDTASKSVRESNTGNSTNNLMSTSTTSSQASSGVHSENKNKYSDTPQGALTGLENDTYLTNASIDTTDGRQNSSGSGSESVASTNVENVSNTKTGTESNNVASTDAYIETIQGYEGRNASKSIEEFRRTLLNIDMQIINDLEVLFMQIW